MAFAEDADGYRPVWARGGYSKEDFMKAKAHWAAQPKFEFKPSPSMTKHVCPTCNKIKELPEGEVPPWVKHEQANSRSARPRFRDTSL